VPSQRQIVKAEGREPARMAQSVRSAGPERCRRPGSLALRGPSGRTADCRSVGREPAVRLVHAGHRGRGRWSPTATRTTAQGGGGTGGRVANRGEGGGETRACRLQPAWQVLRRDRGVGESTLVAVIHVEQDRAWFWAAPAAKRPPPEVGGASRCRIDGNNGQL